MAKILDCPRAESLRKKLDAEIQRTDARLERQKVIISRWVTVLVLRYRDKKTYRQIGAMLGISQNRARDLEKQALWLIPLEMRKPQYNEDET